MAKRKNKFGDKKFLCIAGKTAGQQGAIRKPRVPCLMFCGLRNLVLSKFLPGDCGR
jgi:hypothetical protein